MTKQQALDYESDIVRARLGAQLSVHMSGLPWTQYVMGGALIIFPILVSIDMFTGSHYSAVAMALLVLAILLGGRIIWQARKTRRQRHRIIVYENGLRWFSPTDTVVLFWRDISEVQGAIETGRPSDSGWMVLGFPHFGDFDGDGDAGADDALGCLAVLLFFLVAHYISKRRSRAITIEDGSPQRALEILRKKNQRVARYTFYSGERMVLEFETLYYHKTDGRYFVSLLERASQQAFRLHYSALIESKSDAAKYQFGLITACTIREWLVFYCGASVSTGWRMPQYGST